MHAPGSRELPFAERSRHDDDDSATEGLIRTVVDAFYDAIRRDDLVGPIFAERITDWSVHLAKMYDFWSTIMLRSGRYVGRPLEVHMRISELREDHFRRWLDLWKTTVEHHVPGPVRGRFMQPAVRMAYSMSQHRARRRDESTPVGEDESLTPTSERAQP